MFRHRPRPHLRVLFCLLWRAQPYGGMGTWGSSALTGEIGKTPPLSHGLSNSASFVVQMLVDAGIEASLVHVYSDNDIWKEIKAYDPTHVVIEAFWMRPKKLDDLQPIFPNVKFIIRGHSSTPFLAHDSEGFKWALSYLTYPGAAVAPNDLRHLKEMRFLAQQVFGSGASQAFIERKVPYLPNFYPDDGCASAGQHQDHDHTFIDIGCFGAARPFKNMVAQGIAAQMFASQIGRRLRFHINGDRIECGGGPTVKNLEWIFDVDHNAELVRHDWMPHDEFKALVASMDITMQVSFAETFNIVAADAASQGVPVVGSSEIPWLPAPFCADPTDPDDIVRVMHHAWDTRFENRFVSPVRAALRKYAANTRAVWLDYFGG